jgi:arsenical pump membrane protein
MKNFINLLRSYPITLATLGTLISTLIFSNVISITLFVFAIAGVVLIVFGEHFPFEITLQKKFGIHREISIPLLLFILALFTGALHVPTILTVFLQKIDIIMFIFCMAFLSQGLDRSGFFAFIAYHFIQMARGHMHILILCIFLLSSILAYATTNDLVIIVLTPIIFSIAVQSQIKNVKLLLIGEFVAANITAMGQLWGSPTNIIFAKTLNLSFFQYTSLMIIPTILCTALSLIALFIITTVVKFFPQRWQWEYVDNYTMQENYEFSSFTLSMLCWTLLFCATFLLVIFATNTHRSLFYAIIPAFVGAIGLIYIESTKTAIVEITASFKRIPYGIFFFSMFYFSLVAELIKTRFITNEVVPFLTSLLNFPPPIVSVFGTIGTSMVVNTLNDLPSAAIIAEILQRIHSTQTTSQLAFMQSILIGLNLGTCLTPVGALAGMIWLNIIRTEQKRYHLKNMIIPTRIDLVCYSLIQFIPVAVLTSIISSLFVHR